ncbi:hypothetical protein CHARACLAT_003099 [Characodon lateralis]|uniref:Flotillin n=1 Tax=Characodon lateralis TaxID=208331 RepID=A0ABU7CWA5_9TELE|nr:hypothetical protein [Characodon lateralis]
MGNCHTVGPNEALVVSGGCCGSDQKTYVVGGWAWAWWLISDIQRITLEIMTLQPKCEDVETAEGVAITVTGVAQVNHHTFLGMPDQTPLTPYPYLPFSGKKGQSRRSIFYSEHKMHSQTLGQIVCMILPSYQNRLHRAEIPRFAADSVVIHVCFRAAIFFLFKGEMCDQIKTDINTNDPQ